MESSTSLFVSFTLLFYFGVNCMSITSAGLASHDELWLVQTKNQFPKFDYLGKVGDKRLYVELTFRNWNDSSNFCESMGMKIARLEKTFEGGFLKAVLNETASVNYWVDGIDAANENQVSYSDGSPSKTELEVVYLPRTCSHLHTTPKFNPTVPRLGHNMDCTTTLYPVLCQI